METTLYRRFFRDAQGGVAVEFVTLMPAFVFLTFFIIEIGVALLWIGTVEKAAQLGARMAVVSDYAVTGLPTSGKNAIANGFLPGGNCKLVGQSQNPCVAFNSGNALSCPGSCNPQGFDAIFNRMDAIASMLQPSNVAISYTYAGLGFAGGPIVPRVTVTVQNVPYDSVMTSLLNRFYRLATGNQSANLGMTLLPVITATFTGEDLSSAAAS